jgi:hypothetical protein
MTRKSFLIAQGFYEIENEGVINAALRFLTLASIWPAGFTFLL